MQNKSTSVIEPGVFADPTVDYAFKRIFGTERFKEATIGLLNSIIKEHKISDISFLNVEMPRETKNGKTSVIDVLCEDPYGNTFIVEIQKIKQMTFRERMVYYASRVVSITKGMKGDSEYNLGSTYTIAFCCFDTNAFLSTPLKDGRYAHHYTTTETTTGEKMPASPEFFLFDLTHFTKTLGESLTEEEFWLFLLKEAKNLEEIPDELGKSDAFKAYFEAAQLANFTPEEILTYEQDMMTDRDIRNGMKEARAEGLAEGLAEGIAQGKAEGLAEGLAQGEANGIAKGKVEMARAMKADGMALNVIAKYSGLSEEEIAKL